MTMRWRLGELYIPTFDSRIRREIISSIRISLVILYVKSHDQLSVVSGCMFIVIQRWSLQPNSRLILVEVAKAKSINGLF